MNDEITSWTELREFKAVDLMASYVLSWHLEGGALILEADVCLAPEHAFYENPRPSESACIRPGVLEFPNCTSLGTAGTMAEGAAMVGLAGGLGHGRIHGLLRTSGGVYQLQGQFGEVTVRSERPILRL